MGFAKIVNTTKKVEVEVCSLSAGNWFFWQSRLYVVVINAGKLHFAKAKDGVCESLPNHVMVQPVDVTVTFSLDLSDS